MSTIFQKIVDVSSTVAAFAAVGIAGLVFMRSNQASSGNLLDGPPVEVEDWEQYGDVGHRVGPANAAVTIVEWGDYECPGCRAANPHIRFVLENYSEDVAIVYRHWPLGYHDLAYPAARAVECASNQGKFESYHERLYSSTEWYTNSQDFFLSYAEDLGVSDLQGFKECLSQIDPVPTIEEDILAATAIGGIGTPTVLVNDKLLRAFPDSIVLKELILQELED